MNYKKTMHNILVRNVALIKLSTNMTLFLEGTVRKFVDTLLTALRLLPHGFNLQVGNTHQLVQKH